MEIWRTVVGHPNHEVSSHGRIRRSVDSRRYKHGFVLKPYINKQGYMQTTIDRKCYRVHRLMLAAFVGPCPPKHQCNHKDGDKTNNHVSNLEWVTHSENMYHAFKTGLVSKRGEKNPQSKLKEGEVWLIKKLLKSHLCQKGVKGKLKQRKIAKMFKVGVATISLIKSGHRWT